MNGYKNVVSPIHHTGSIPTGLIPTPTAHRSKLILLSVTIHSHTVSLSTITDRFISSPSCFRHTTSTNENVFTCSWSPKSKLLVCISTSMGVPLSSNQYSYSNTCHPSALVNRYCLLPSLSIYHPVSYKSGNVYCDRPPVSDE